MCRVEPEFVGCASFCVPWARVVRVKLRRCGTLLAAGATGPQTAMLLKKIALKLLLAHNHRGQLESHAFRKSRGQCLAVTTWYR